MSPASSIVIYKSEFELCRSCGSVGNVCSSSGTGVSSVSCISGSCAVTCKTGYTASTNGKTCNAIASAKARAKKRTTSATLCPLGDSACPIVGSSSFDAFVNSRNRELAFANAAGGYECVDTTNSIESCGGCSSTGAGTDCSTIPHAVGVGCTASRCVIFSCARGYTRSLNATRCERSSSRRTKIGSHGRSQLLH